MCSERKLPISNEQKYKAKTWKERKMYGQFARNVNTKAIQRIGGYEWGEVA